MMKERRKICRRKIKIKREKEKEKSENKNNEMGIERKFMKRK